MLIDFTVKDETNIPGMNGGTGTMPCRMFNDGRYRIIPTRSHPKGSRASSTLGWDAGAPKIIRLRQRR